MEVPQNEMSPVIALCLVDDIVRYRTYSVLQQTVSTPLSAAHLPSRGDGSLRRSDRIRVWQGASVMANHSSRSIIVPPESVEELFDALSALPRLTRCRTCGTELLHV